MEAVAWNSHVHRNGIFLPWWTIVWATNFHCMNYLMIYLFLLKSIYIVLGKLVTNEHATCVVSLTCLDPSQWRISVFLCLNSNIVHFVMISVFYVLQMRCFSKPLLFMFLIDILNHGAPNNNPVNSRFCFFVSLFF